MRHWTKFSQSLHLVILVRKIPPPSMKQISTKFSAWHSSSLNTCSLSKILCHFSASKHKRRSECLLLLLSQLCSSAPLMTTILHSGTRKRFRLFIHFHSRPDRVQSANHLEACRLHIQEQRANLKLHKRELRKTKRALVAYEHFASHSPNHQDTHGLGAHQPSNASVPIPQATSCNTLEASTLSTTLAQMLAECETLRSERKDLQGQMQQITNTVDKIKEGETFWGCT